MDENFAMNTQSIDSQPEAGSRVRWPIRNQIMLPMVSLMVARLVAVSVLNAFLSVRRTHRRIARELNEVACTAGDELTDRLVAAHHRRAVRQVLVDQSYLVITRRSIPQLIPGVKCATIT